MLLAQPVVYLFFERNAFDAQATQMTSSALFFYSIGLVGSSLRLMLNKVFYSFQDTKTPMVNGTIAVILNVVLNLLFIRFMAHDGLALVTSISAIFTTILLFMDLRKKMGPIGMKDMLMTFAKTLFASIVMGAVVYLIYFKIGSLIGVNKLVELILLLLSVVIGAIVYFVICMALKVKEVSRILRFIR